MSQSSTLLRNQPIGSCSEVSELWIVFTVLSFIASLVGNGTDRKHAAGSTQFLMREAISSQVFGSLGISERLNQIQMCNSGWILILTTRAKLQDPVVASNTQSNNQRGKEKEKYDFSQGRAYVFIYTSLENGGEENTLSDRGRHGHPRGAEECPYLALHS